MTKLAAFIMSKLMKNVLCFKKFSLLELNIILKNAMNLGNKQIELKNTVKFPKNFKYFSLFLEFNPIKNLPK